MPRRKNRRRQQRSRVSAVSVTATRRVHHPHRRTLHLPRKVKPPITGVLRRSTKKPVLPLISTGLVDTPISKKLEFKKKQINRWLPPSHRLTLLCVNRKVRKQVLFAKKLTGKGTHGKKHFTPKSSLHCS